MIKKKHLLHPPESLQGFFSKLLIHCPVANPVLFVEHRPGEGDHDDFDGDDLGIDCHSDYHHHYPTQYILLNTLIIMNPCVDDEDNYDGEDGDGYHSHDHHHHLYAIYSGTD